MTTKQIAIKKIVLARKLALAQATIEHHDATMAVINSQIEEVKAQHAALLARRA